MCTTALWFSFSLKIWSSLVQKIHYSYKLVMKIYFSWTFKSTILTGSFIQRLLQNLWIINCFAWELPKKNFTGKQTERQYKADIGNCDCTYIKLQGSSSKHFPSMAASWLIRLIFLAVKVLSANLLVISNSDFCASVFETKNGKLTRSAL